MSLETVNRWCTDCIIVKAIPLLRIRSPRKCCRKSSLARFLTDFKEWPLLLSYVEYSKKVLNLIDDSP